MHHTNGFIQIMNEWKRAGRGVFSEANAELQTTHRGRELLYECYQLFTEIHKIPCINSIDNNNNLFPIFYYDYETIVDGFPWRSYLSVIHCKACILMIKPFPSLDDIAAMESQCLTRAAIWSSHCMRRGGQPAPPIHYDEFIALYTNYLPDNKQQPL